MRKVLKFLLAAGIVSVSLGSIPAVSYAKESPHYSVTEFGADGSDQNDDAAAFQAALDKAKGATETVTVEVPEGEYYIGSTLAIYSNTIFKLSPKAIIKRQKGFDGWMLTSAHLKQDGTRCWCSLESDGCTHGQYNQGHDISISGGIWDGNIAGDTTKGYSSFFAFSHATDIAVSDMTLQNSSCIHAVELNAVNNCKFDKVTFKDIYPYTGNDIGYWFADNKHTEAEARAIIAGYTQADKVNNVYAYKEAIHLDIADKEGNNAYPLDNTPCKNITVNECTFNNVLTAIGSHITRTGHSYSNLTVSNSSFANIKSSVLSTAGISNVIFQNNEVTNAEYGIMEYGCDSKTNAIVSSSVQSIGNSFSSVGCAYHLSDMSLLDAKEDTITCKSNSLISQIGASVNNKSNANFSVCSFSGFLNKSIYAMNNSTIFVEKCSFSNDADVSINTIASNSTISNSTFTNGKKSAIVVINGQTSINKCSVSKFTEAAINVDGAKLLGVKDCTVDTVGRGIYVINATGDRIISGNHIKNVGGKSYGISVKNTAADSNLTTIFGNTVENAYTGICIDNLSSATIEQNTVTSSQSIGMSLNNSSNLTVKGNKVTKSGSTYDIAFWGCKSGLCTGNYSTDKPLEQIYSNTSGIQIKDNFSSAPKNGWFKEKASDGSEYYVYYDKGIRIQSKFYTVSGKTYYFRESGKMQTGWAVINGKDYYFESSGAMVTGWNNKIKPGKWYFFKSNGELIYGWAKISNVWYYFNPTSGIMQTGWQKIGGKDYYFESSGAMVTGWNNKIKPGKWYLFKSSGELVYGWAKVSNVWYYFNPTSGIMQTGWQRIGGKDYYLESSGAMVTGWNNKIKPGKWYFFKSSGELVYGWAKISNVWYYFNPTSGIMQTGWLKDGGKWYYLNKSGAMVTGTQIIEGKKYVFNSSGAMQ